MRAQILSIVLFLTIFSAASQQELSQQSLNRTFIIKNIPITQYGVANRWDTIRSALAQQPVPNQLVIQNNIVSIAGLEQLFSEDLSNIKNFTIKGTVINEPIMKYLLNQSRFYEFQKIALVQCNLMSDDFSSITPRETKIKSLNFKNNRLSTQAFKSLSKLSMNLQQFSIVSASLIQDQAVQAIIDFGLSNIKKLQLGSTGISGDNLLKILRSLNTSKLDILDIGKNDYPLSFYRQFSKFKFDSLRLLELSKLQIDEDGFEYLNNMKFPKLKSLILDNNQLSTQMSYKFMTKQRFPSLSFLSINYNFLNSSFFSHVKKQGFIFTALMSFIPKMDLKGLKQISSLDLTQLQAIMYSARATTPQITKQFLQTINQNAQNLKILDISAVNDKGDYIQYIFNRRWPKLQKLVLDDIGMIDQEVYQQEQPIFPELRMLTLSIQGFQITELSTLFKHIQKIAPKIQRIEAKSPIIAKVIGQLFNQQIKNSHTRPIDLILTGLGSFSVTLDPISKPKIKVLYLQDIFINYLISKGLDSIAGIISGGGDIQINPQELDLQQLLDLQNKMNHFQDQLHNNFDLSQLQFLHETNDLNFIKRLLLNSNRKYVFENLKTLHMMVSEDTQIQQIKYCEFPLLQTLVIQDGGIDEQSQITLDFATNKFLYISQLVLGLELPIQQIRKFFNINNFTYLIDFALKSLSNLQSSDIAQIQACIPYFYRLHRIDYSSAFLHKDLTFLANSGIQPQKLILNQILFKNGVFQQLCNMSFQFAGEIIMENCGIDDNAMIQWLNCMKNKVKANESEGYIYFPKLIGINLQKNYIGTKGFQLFMSMGLPSLMEVGFNRNMDSQLFNSIFKSQWSKRIVTFASTYNKFYGIDGTLNPRNTRRILQFGLQTASLMDTDIQALAKYEFPSLQLIQLQIGKIENCLFLQNLVQFFRTAIDITLSIDDSPLLNSTCLMNNKQYPEFAPQMIVIKGSQYYGQIKEFSNKFLNKNSQLRRIILLNNYASQSKLIQMLSSSDLSNLTQIVLGPDQVTDELCNILFKFNPQQIQTLGLPGNPITAKGISYLNNINFTNLQFLDLSGSDIGDEGIKYLVRNNFPKLRVLYLRNCDLTKQGILQLNKLKAKNLMTMDLSSNGLEFDDLALLKTSGFPMLINVILYPTMKKSQYDKLMEIYKKKKSFFSMPVAIMTTQIQILEYQLEEDAYFDDEEDNNLQQDYEKN